MVIYIKCISITIQQFYVCLRILLYNTQINTLITKSTFLCGSSSFFLLLIILYYSLYSLLYLYLVSRGGYSSVGELTQTKYAQKSIYIANILILETLFFIRRYVIINYYHTNEIKINYYTA